MVDNDAIRALMKQLQDDAILTIAEKGYSAEFIKTIYDATNNLDSFHDDTDWIAEAIDNGESESSILSKLQNSSKD